MTPSPDQTPHNPDQPGLLAFRVEGGPEDGRLIVAEDAGRVALETKGILPGYPAIELPPVDSDEFEGGS